MFYVLGSPRLEELLQEFDPRRTRAQRVQILAHIDRALAYLQDSAPIEIDGRALVGLAAAAAALARALRANKVDPYWLAEFTARGVDRGAGTADRRKAARLIRRLRRDTRVLSAAVRRTIDLPQHKAPIRQGQRTDPRTDDVVTYLRSAWNRGTGYYPTLSSPESEFARIALTIASDPGWRDAGLPKLTYSMLRDRITATALLRGSRWTRERLPPKKTSATSRARHTKSRK